VSPRGPRRRPGGQRHWELDWEVRRLWLCQAWGLAEMDQHRWCRQSQLPYAGRLHRLCRTFDVAMPYQEFLQPSIVAWLKSVYKDLEDGGHGLTDRLKPLSRAVQTKRRERGERGRTRGRSWRSWRSWRSGRGGRSSRNARYQHQHQHQQQ
jgi:hypothetical protein